ncbi:MAG: C-terminal target protein [Flavipsychrobacter sp.]|nr:C-terminal target protein [Flavipsychrobacter sp.]
MRKISALLFLVAASLSASAQSITWALPMTVNTGAGNNLHPRISLNRTGNPYVLWGKTDSKAYFSKLSGGTFTAPVALNSSFNVFAQSWAGPDMAAFGDTIYASMKVTPEMPITNYTYLVHSYDGGASFSMPVRIDNIDTSTSRFPIVTTTTTGNPMVAFMKFNNSMMDAHYVVSTSADGGATFAPDALASGMSGEVCDCCPASLISSGSKTIMLFRNNLSNVRDIYSGVSSDGGATFPGTMNVDKKAWALTSCPSSGPDGYLVGDTIYTVYYSAASGTALVYLSRASVSGMSSSSKAITGTFTGLLSQNYPRIANWGNAAAIVWKQNTSLGNMICYSFTDNIATKGFTTIDTIATGSGLVNADVAMNANSVQVVWEDDNTNKVMYKKGAYTLVPSLQKEVTRRKIDLYPNPASESFTVRLENTGTITGSYLSDVAGRRTEITSVYKNNTATYSLKGIAKGAYYFVVTEEGGDSYYSKLIVE